MTDDANVLQRLCALERQNRQLRRGLVVAAVVIGLIVVSGQAKSEGDGPKSLEVTNLKLLDARGNIRAQLGVAEAGPALNFYDKNEKSRIALALHNDDETLLMHDANGVPRCELGVRENVPTLRLQRTSGKVGVQAFVSEENGAGWEMNGAGGAAGMRMVVADDGNALVIGDKTGKVRLLAGVSTENQTRFLLTGEDGEVIFQQPE